MFGDKSPGGIYLPIPVYGRRKSDALHAAIIYLILFLNIGFFVANVLMLSAMNNTIDKLTEITELWDSFKVGRKHDSPLY